MSSEDFYEKEDIALARLREVTDAIYDWRVTFNELSKQISDRPLGSPTSATVTINAGGVAVGVAVTACICTVFMMVIFSGWCWFEFGKQAKTIDDLTQWRNVHSDKIARLEAEVKK